MATLPKTGTVTYEEWLRMPETNLREEVVNGEIRVMPANRMPHARVIQKLTRAFDRQLDPKVAEVFGSTFGLVIRKSPLTSRAPDIAVFIRSTMVGQDGYCHSAPQLVIEVLSPSETRKGIQEKLRDYESIGVSEVWPVRPEPSHVEVLLLEDGKLRRSVILAEGVLKPKHFPAVEIDIAEIWPD